ncbi:hypothetical protein [Pseudonocardia sp. ICBG1293]|uniref:hypothetical protein n=1 Tax=Pseudonocardia sp. ICBG1293 TaxID=2844382 RepID=UPI001CCA08DB|nr:hypothetical protein [Pseudonocardia sp. ICBG1293]
MPCTATAAASPTGRPRSLRCRRPAGSGHRAAAGELAALAFDPPSGPVGPVPAASPQLPAVAVGPQRDRRAVAARPVPVPRPRPATP